MLNAPEAVGIVAEEQEVAPGEMGTGVVEMVVVAPPPVAAAIVAFVGEGYMSALVHHASLLAEHASAASACLITPFAELAVAMPAAEVLRKVVHFARLRGRQHVSFPLFASVERAAQYTG